MVIGMASQKEETALVKAVKNSNLTQVSVLVARNINANAQALDGTTALMVAAEKGYAQIASLLLDKGADVNYRRKKFGATALMLAAGHGRAEIVEVLLSRGANVNTKMIMVLLL
jgi:FOG: Ankyrin repeat